MNSFIKNTLSFVLFSMVLIGYQNCGETGTFGSFTKTSERDSFRFPIKAEADYLGYMSCSGMQNSTGAGRGFFTFKIMSDSYSRGLGGIGLDTTFIEEVEYEKQKRPATFDLQDELYRALDENSKFDETYLQFSLATEEQPERVSRDTKTGIFYVDQMPQYEENRLDSSNMISALSKKTDDSALYNTPFGLSVDLRILSYDSLTKTVDNGVLVLGYSTDRGTVHSGEYNRSPSEYEGETMSGAYGRMFKFSHQYNRLDYLREYEAAAVNGYNEEKTGKNWDCKTLTIVRPTADDIENARVHPTLTPAGHPDPFGVTCLGSGEEFKPLISVANNFNLPRDRALNEILGTEWYVNPNMDCIIHQSYFENPESPVMGCYGGYATSTKVNYKQFGGGEEGELDANYATVCYANN